MLLEDGYRPLVLGGDYSLLIGIGAALADSRDRHGLAFIDGHQDFYTGRTSPTGEAADLELAVLLGLGAAPLVGLARQTPSLTAGQVVHLGARDAAGAAGDGAPDPLTLMPEMLYLDAHTVITRGPGPAAARALGRLGPRSGYWVHVDLDVLSTEALPAVDHPPPGGLSWHQLAELVAPLLRAPGFLGMDVTIDNPTLDPDASSSRAILAWLTRVLSTPARSVG